MGKLAPIIPVLVTLGGLLLGVIGWASAGFPPLATQTYVDGTWWRIACRQYKNQIRIDQIDRFQWETNAKPYSEVVQGQIDMLNADIAYLNGQISQNCS